MVNQTLRKLMLLSAVALLFIPGWARCETPLPTIDPPSGQGLPLQSFLDAEGRIDIEALKRSGYEGPLDMRGLCTRLNPRTGELISEPGPATATRMPGDEHWLPGFGHPDPRPGVNHYVYALLVHDGELIVGGTFTEAGVIQANFIARWDGTSWISMPSPPVGHVRGLTIFRDEMVAGGSYGVARWTGGEWVGFGSFYNANYYDPIALATFGDNLFVGGSFFWVNGIMAPSIARWDGEVWAPVGPGLNGPVKTLAAHDGWLVAGGSFSAAGSLPVSNIARWNGVNWSAMDAGMDGSVSALLSFQGDLIAGGYFWTAGGSQARSIAKWDGSSWSSLPGGPDAEDWVNVLALREHQQRLAVGGSFTWWNGSPAGGVAQFDGVSWDFLGGGVNGSVGALATYGAELVVGGSIYTAGEVECRNIARWDGFSWGRMIEPPGAGLDGVVYAVAVYQGSLVAGGWFYTAGNASVNNIALWDGNAWTPLGDGVNSYVLALAVDGQNLYAGGGFSSAGGQAADFVARWDGAWHNLGGGTNTVVKALGFYDGDLHAGGHFTRADGQPASHVARWDGLAWSPLGSGTDGVVNALLEHDGALFVGGEFGTAGGWQIPYLARWDGTSWSSPDPNWWYYDGPVYSLASYRGDLCVGADQVLRLSGTGWTNIGGTNYANALCVYNDWLIVGGYAGAEASNIARWNGGIWDRLGSGTNSTVQALAVLGEDLYVGGDFSSAGGKSALRMGLWSDPTIACGVAVTQPVGGEALRSGDSVDILWDRTGDCGSLVRIEMVSFDYGVTPIAEATENDGHFSWTIADYPDTASCWIRITDLDTGSADESERFTIAPVCALQVYQPGGGESYEEGWEVWIVWYSSWCGSRVRIDLLQGGEPCALIAESVENYGGYLWLAEPCPPDTAGYQIRVTDPESGRHADSGFFTILFDPAGVAEPDLAARIPERTALHPIRPNPVAAGATLAFDLATEAEVALEIFDAAGRLVERLAAGTLPAGSYKLAWRGMDRSGNGLPSGIYFYRLRAGEFSQTRKILLAK